MKLSSTRRLIGTRTTLASAAAAALAALASTAGAAPDPPPEGYTLANASTGLDESERDGLTQLAFRPGDPTHVFAARSYRNVVTRYHVDAESGMLSNATDVATDLVFPIGVAFHADDMYVTENGDGDGGITRLRDVDGDGLFEERSRFVRGIPRGSHHVNQLAIRDGVLVTSIGMASNSGHPDCENAYTGTLAWIADLDATDHSGANTLPDAEEFMGGDALDGRVRRYATNFRNAFGVLLTPEGEVWATDNGARACGSCCAGNELPDDTDDFLYANVRLGDGGAFPPPGLPGSASAPIAPLAAFPEHMATTGLAFMPGGPGAGDVVVAIYGPTIETKPLGRNLVLVDAASGDWDVFIDGFDRPIDVVADPSGRLLIADRDAAAIYLLTPDVETPVGPGEATSPPVTDHITVRASPNPLGGYAAIDVALESSARVIVDVHDVAGRHTIRLHEGTLGPGSHRIGWDGRDAAGRRLPAGVYLVRVTSGTASRNVPLVRID